MSYSPGDELWEEYYDTYGEILYEAEKEAVKDDICPAIIKWSKGKRFAGGSLDELIDADDLGDYLIEWGATDWIEAYVCRDGYAVVDDYTLNEEEIFDFLTEYLEFVYNAEGDYWWTCQDFDFNKHIANLGDKAAKIINDGDWMCSLNGQGFWALYDFLDRINGSDIHDNTATDEEKYMFDHFDEQKNALRDILNARS